MPSTVVGNHPASGPMILVSGNPWSGQNVPVGGIQLYLHPNASGMVYVGLSGAMTLNSGSVFLSGGGLNDAMAIAPGGAYFIPRVAFKTSGTVNVYVHNDAAASGQARLFYEIY